MNIKQWLFILVLSLFAIFALYQRYWPESSKSADEVSSQKVVEGEAPMSSAEKNVVTIILMFVGLIPLLVGLSGFNSWFSKYNLAMEARHWPIIEGRVLEKSIGIFRSATDTGHMDPSSMTYYPEIVYSFDVDGKKVRSSSNALNNGATLPSEEAVETLLDQLPSVGEPVDVRFDSKTGRSTLKYDTKSKHNYWPLVFLPLTYALGLGLCFLAWRARF